MEKISIPLALIAVGVLAVLAFYGAPLAVASYQTHAARVEVTAAQSAYASDIADAKARRDAEEKAVQEHYTDAVERAQETRAGSMQQIRLEYPHATLPRVVAIREDVQ